MSQEDDTPKLPQFVEGMLQMFEGFKGREIVFRCVTRQQKASCAYCGESTLNRLETFKDGDSIAVFIACRPCLRNAGEASRNE